MASSHMIAKLEDGARLKLIRDAVRKLYGVNIVAKFVRSEDNDASDVCEERTGVDDVGEEDVCSDDGRVLCDSYTSRMSSISWTSSKKPPVLEFEADAAPEIIEKAKNFAEAHLFPSLDYTTRHHKLHNQEEAKMVLKNSSDIQTATSALLILDPDSLELILHGPANSVSSASSQVTQILEKLRKTDKNKDNSLRSGTLNDSCQTFGNNYISENNNNNNDDCLGLSHIIKSSGNKRKIKSMPQKSRGNNDSFQRNEWQNQFGSNQNFQILDDQNVDDHIVDQSQLKSDPGRSFLRTCKTCTQAQNKSSHVSSFLSSSSSSDIEASPEEVASSDPRFLKKVVQAMKLGYSERQVTEVITKLGPECSFNDILSGLINLEGSDSSLSPSEEEPLPATASIFVESNEGGEMVENVNPTLVGYSVALVDNPEVRSSSVEGLCGGVDESDESGNLRDVIIDGSNVAMSHGKKIFSCKGIQIAVDWFRDRGHKNITAFVPQWRKETSRPDAPISDQEILSDLEKEGIVVFTPARRVKGRRVVCYDDRYILKLAVETDGIVVSNDVYRDLVNEREDFRQVVDQRLLMYTFANDRFMPPEDPLGRLGPTLDNFLRKSPIETAPRPQDCPYGKKCTYGNKCRFYHPERGFAPQKSVTETLKEQAELKLQERTTKMSEFSEKGKRPRQKLTRTKSLIPRDSQFPSTPSTFPTSEVKPGPGKPKFSHSKSLIFPKTPDYLNESRRKLEEAELAAELEKMSSQEKFSDLYFSAHSDKRSNLKTPSPKPSPSPQKDDLRQNAAPTSVQIKSSSPMKSVSPLTPSMSPSLLAVPVSEPPEGYLSGHLYLAKKLSDDSIENNFFFEYTSSPSSTRTSSPVVSSTTVTDQKQEDLDSRSRELANLFPSTSYISSSSSSQHQQRVAYTPQKDQHPGTYIPDTVLFESGNFKIPPNFTPFVSPPLYRHHNTDDDDAMVTDSSNIDPLSPDSGRFTLTEHISSPYQSHIQSEYPQQQLKSYPMSKTEQARSPRDQLNLWRAYSSIDNVKTAEDVYQKFGRRYSGVCLSQLREDHTISTPENRLSHFHGLTRQNSSSDPQIHNISGDHVDLLTPVLGARNISGFGQKALDTQKQQPEQYHQLEGFQNLHLGTQQRLSSVPHHIQQQQNSQPNLEHFQPSSRLMTTPGMESWKNPYNQNLYNQAPLFIGTRQSQFSHQNTTPFNNSENHFSIQSSVPFHNASQSSHFTSKTNHPIAVSPYIMNQSQVQNLTHPQQMYVNQHPIPIPAPSASMRPLPPGSSFASQPGFHQASLGRGIQPYHLASPPPAVSINEDAAILPDDPRYTIYYHLSNVFGEQLVRRVMNRHPNVLTPDQICTLIMSYNKGDV